MASPASLAGRRLAFVTRNLGVGGAERQATLLASYLKREQAAEVDFWCFDLVGRNRQTLEDAAVPVRELNPGPGGGPFARSLQIVSFVFRARRLRPAFLLPFTDFPNKLCCALWPLMGAEGALWNQRDEGRERTGRPVERLALRYASRFVCNSGAGVRFLRDGFGVHGSRIELIPNAVVLDAPKMPASQWRQMIGLDPDQALVVMVANLQRFKDHVTLLRAWRQVLEARTGPAPVLALAGRPATTGAELEALARELDLGESVRFLGEVDDVPGLLGAADLCAHSSIREGCPNGILEPMAAGLPVVATDIEGAREALGEDYPHLVRPQDAGHLAHEIARLIGDGALRHRLGEANQRRVVRVFNPESTHRRYAQLIAGLLGGFSRRVVGRR